MIQLWETSGTLQSEELNSILERSKQGNGTGYYPNEKWLLFVTFLDTMINICRVDISYRAHWQFRAFQVFDLTMSCEQTGEIALALWVPWYFLWYTKRLVHSVPALLLFMMTSSNGNFCAFLELCSGNSPVTGEFSTKRPETRSFDIFFDLRMNKRLNKKSRAVIWDAIAPIMTSL